MSENMTIEDLAKNVEGLVKVVGNLTEEVRSGFARMATKEEMNSGFTRMATKEEMNSGFTRMATKEDLENVKTDLENLAIMTKQGFDQTATKEDFRFLADGLEIVKQEVGEINTKLSSLDKKVDDNYDEFNEETNELKIRVNKLEDKVFVT